MVRFSGNFQFCKPMKAREAVDTSLEPQLLTLPTCKCLQIHFLLLPLAICPPLDSFTED